MTKISAISILKHQGQNKTEASILTEHQDLASFNFFQRNGVSEFMSFTSKIVTQRTPAGSRQSVKQQEYMCHCYVKPDGLAGVIIADVEYPARVAFTLISKLLEEFHKQNLSWPEWSNTTSPNDSSRWDTIKEWVVKYQDPQQADSLCRVQKELDETKVVLHQTLEGLLNRGEKLDDLVSRSDMLSQSSKAFYQTAKSTNSWCCTIM